MLSQIHGANLIKFGTTKHMVNGRKKRSSLRGTRYSSSFHNKAAISRGIQKPVFLNQNHRTFSLQCPQPNSQPMNARVLTAEPCVDPSICGIAMTEATT